MNFSLQSMVLYGLILLFAIVSGMENENDQIVPNAIRISGRMGNDNEINGSYFKSDKLHNGRVYYHTEKESFFIYWNENQWQIGNNLENKKQFLANLQENVLDPTLGTKYWFMYNLKQNQFTKDENIVVEKIKIEEADSESFSCPICFYDHPFGVVAQCGHKHCITCLKDIYKNSKNKPKCSVCRLSFSKTLDICDINFKNLERTDVEYDIEHLKNEFPYLPLIDNTSPADIKKFLEKDARVMDGISHFTGYTALMNAVIYENFDLVKCLVDHGSNINYATNSGVKAFHLAGSHGKDLRIFQYLMEGKTLENDVIPGKTALFFATRAGNLEAVNYLISQGHNVNEKNQNDKITPLMLAAINGDLEIFNVLLENGADIYKKSLKNWTTLHFAINHQHSEIVKILLESDAKTKTIFKSLQTSYVNTLTHEGYSPLDLAKNNDTIAQSLNNYGAKMARKKKSFFRKV